jgi:hypothetical protein
MNGIMRLGKFIIAAAVLQFFVQSAYGQRAYGVPKKDPVEVGVFIGASNYSGDLEENIINIDHTQLGYGGIIRYNFSTVFSLKFGLDWGTISDEDASATDLARQRRNLSFRSSVFAGYIAPELYFANWRFADKKFVQPYIFAGLGAFHFNPQAQYKGTWYDLQPLGTEGQGTLEYADRQPYSLNQIYIPFGMGFRVALSSTWFMNIEFRGGKTFTDYLDDVSTTYASPDVLTSQHNSIAAALGNRTPEVNPTYHDLTGYRRGDPKQKDMFFFTGFTFSHYFRNKRRCYSF